ncbi:MAG: aldolase [Candidatus Hydrogenedentes bacterium]|nr:aldolase [Candidatus Hydrogenedentota bacterium]
MTGSEIKKALKAGKRVFGTCITSPSPIWPAAIAGCGVDFVFIDNEHIPLDRSQDAWICQAFQALGIATVVRIPKVDAAAACQMLDAGATGIVAPYMESPEEVQALRGSVRFHPLKGRRLQEALASEDTLNDETRACLDKHNADKMLLVNVESVPALERLDEILSVPGIDVALAGPHDLSINLGVPEQYAHPKFVEAMAHIIRTAEAHGVAPGFHFTPGKDTTGAWTRMGARFVVHSTDIFMVQDTLRTAMSAYHAEFGQAGGGGQSGAPRTVVV